MRRYQPHLLEKKWQEIWAEKSLYKSRLEGRKPYYVLAEFAYPSGDLHIGHAFTWTGADVFARFKRMSGFDVFFPNGFDAFGLPAENAAIKHGVHPKDWTYANIESMKIQFGKMGGSFSFDHEVVTCDPAYYKWNQWLFLKMCERGLAYKGEALSNWCETCQTVLANEGVEAGRCWRCHNPVVQKMIPQWFFKITDYGDKLIWKGYEGVDWPQSVREGQNNWIGRSEGMEIEFRVKGKVEGARGQATIKVFTVFPETIYGVTYLVVSPEYPMLDQLTIEENKAQVERYVKQAKQKTEEERKIGEREKTGEFSGSYVINPVNGEEVPVWVADYVLSGYGTGVVMGVPGSDHRDFEFATKFGLEIRRVIAEAPEEMSKVETNSDVLEEGYLVNSGEFDGLATPGEAREKIKDYLEQKGWGKRITVYHLHDWSVSRQRYWGTPVPIINCPDCGSVAVPYTELPVELPYEVDYTPKGKPPLATAAEWMKVKCPKCGGKATREVETMDTFVDSAWYFFRYLCPDNDEEIFQPELANKWMPVDIYFGGAEHTLGHTLYARFITKVIKDLGLVSFEEFAKRRINHGIVLGTDGARMSKSKGNVVNPDKEIEEYGADTIRTYLCFMMPYDGTSAWVPERINGVYRFLQRVWGLSYKVDHSLEPSREDLRLMHQAIKEVGEDIESIKFNTSVAHLMEWLNYLSAKEKVTGLEYKTLVLLLSPFAPHVCEELWEELGEGGSVHLQDWPVVDEKFLAQDSFEVAVQINGNTRGTIKTRAGVGEDEVVKAVKSVDKIARYLENKEIKKVIIVPKRIVSIVTS